MYACTYLRRQAAVSQPASQSARQQRRAHRERRPRLASPHLTQPCLAWHRLALPRLGLRGPVRARITARERSSLARHAHGENCVKGSGGGAAVRDEPKRNERAEFYLPPSPPLGPLVTWLTPPSLPPSITLAPLRPLCPAVEPREPRNLAHDRSSLFLVASRSRHLVGSGESQARLIRCAPG